MLISAAQYASIRADVSRATGTPGHLIEITAYPATGGIEATVTKGGLARTFTVAPAFDFQEAV
jgi:hypothetical protein